MLLQNKLARIFKLAQQISRLASRTPLTMQSSIFSLPFFRSSSRTTSHLLGYRSKSAIHLKHSTLFSGKPCSTMVKLIFSSRMWLTRTHRLPGLSSQIFMMFYDDPRHLLPAASTAISTIYGYLEPKKMLSCDSKAFTTSG